VIEIAHQRRTGLAAGHVAGGATHIDIDDFGPTGFGDTRAFRHPFGLATRELDDVRPYSGCLASQQRHRPAIDEIIAGCHFGNDESGPERSRETPKRRIGNA